ncbi:hypothetical protein HZU72_10290 [Halomonas sp. QX-2]|jgi:hypothetical protein|uniref:Uncharacterized protein n=1 Tax=Vreelandella sedimenti TaxID=2729618 RepID=A0A7Z0SMG9_9GAMM|nr:hypothetical protein [Halomonas sedimenti]NYT72815.1 hypothetical protein [Halomonas sedimenti]
MSKLTSQITVLSNGYVRKGGKQNRKQQQKRMLAFGIFCSSQGATCMGQVGAKHVIRYWKSESMLDKSDATRLQHYYALKSLWGLAGKDGGPPKPFSSAALAEAQKSREQDESIRVRKSSS